MKAADMVLLNGKVYSITQDDSRVTGTAVAVKDGKILKVGNDELIKTYINNETEVIDCQGNTILPGLCDAHCHPSIAASVGAGCDLFGIYRQEDESADEVIDKYLERLKTFVEEHPEKSLIRGTGWVFGNFSDDRMPTRHDIDKICSDRPVVLESFCQHNLWVNSKAIELAGVDENTPDVQAGRIYREENGYPEGVFNDPEAMAMIKNNVPGYDLSVEEYKEGIMYYQKEYANKYGVTFVQDCMHSDNARAAYVELAKEGKLTARFRGVYMLEPARFKEQLLMAALRKGEDNVGEDFRIDTIKIFAEGMFILDDPLEEEFLKENSLPADFNGPWYWQDDDMISTMVKSMGEGFNIHVHAMGDGSVKQSVRCLAKAQEMAKEDFGIKSPRNIIAHLMLVKDEDAKLMGKAGIIANCQPRWMVYDPDIAAMLPMVGAERAESAYPMRKLLDEGVTVAFGTDFPVTPPPDTMHEIQCCMTRQVFPDAPDYEKFKGKVLGTERPASLAEAVKALSINGAYQMMGEEYTGSIEEGKSAELVILDSDIEITPVEEIYNIAVEKTIFKGRVVYSAV